MDLAGRRSKTRRPVAGICCTPGGRLDGDDVDDGYGDITN